MTVAAILAGGASRRMGQDKSTRILGSKPLLHHVVDAVRPQVSHLIIVGGNKALPEAIGLTAIDDTLPGRRGPLAGILAAMEWFNENNSGAKKLFVTAVDLPFLPGDIVDQLNAEMAGAQSIFPVGENRPQYMAGVWDLALRQDLKKGLDDGQVASVRSFVEGHSSRQVALRFDARNPKPFFNVNSADDLETAHLLLPPD